jgi:hypothetical protein
MNFWGIPNYRPGRAAIKLFTHQEAGVLAIDDGETDKEAYPLRRVTIRPFAIQGVIAGQHGFILRKLFAETVKCLLLTVLAVVRGSKILCQKCP